MSQKTATDERNQAELDRDFAASEAAKKPKPKPSPKPKPVEPSEDKLPDEPRPAKDMPAKKQQSTDDAPDPAEAATILARLENAPEVKRTPLAPYNPNPETRRIATSLKLETPEGRKAAFRAITTQDLRACDVLQAHKVYSVRDWLCHDVSKVGEDGEIQRWVRTVLILEDGRRLSAGSDGLLSSLYSLQLFYGMAPWRPPLQLSVEAGRSQSGRTYYTLDVH